MNEYEQDRMAYNDMAMCGTTGTMTKEQLIEKINNSHFKSLFETDEEIYQYTKGQVASGLKLEEHRWYSTAINVYEVEDGFVGVRGAYQSFSECQDWTDIDYDSKAFPMKAVETITYVAE